MNPFAPAAALLTAASLLLSGCGNKPRAPDWEMNAHDSLERYVKAYFGGKDRAGASEFERARNALESTGQPGLVARAELTRCAVRLASLVMDPRATGSSIACSAAGSPCPAATPRCCGGSSGISAGAMRPAR